MAKGFIITKGQGRSTRANGGIIGVMAREGIVIDWAMFIRWLSTGLVVVGTVVAVVVVVVGC